MGEEILAADEEGMKSMLTMLYDNKPNFPIESDVDIINIFGGPLGSIQINKDEKITSTKLSQRAMEKADKFNSAQELLDAIVGHNYYNLIMKTTILFDIYRNEYPIPSEHEMEDIIHGCVVSGIDKGELLKKLEFPIEKPETIISVLESLEPEVCGPDVPVLKIEMPQPTIRTAEAAEAAKPAVAELPKVDVEFGESFLVEHDKPDYLFKAVGEVLKVSGVKLLCISRSNPKQLRTKFKPLFL